MGYSWATKLDQLSTALSEIVATDKQHNTINVDKAFEQLETWTTTLREHHKTIYAIGNGASASMASHFAADMAKNGCLHTQVFSDLSLITAISNDMSFEQVFAEPLQRRGVAGDLLVCISSSGNSPNILAAAKVARKLKIKVITFSAMTPQNALRQLGNLNFYLPANTYGLAESGHATLLHHWIDAVVDQFSEA